MSRARLSLALERMGPGDWLEFERFAAEFLAPEYPSLRTTASQHGDRGRDGQLYIVDEEPNTMIQYSVASDWDAKIRRTVRRLRETLPSTRRLIYLTNQVVGAKADDLVSEFRREARIALDIRDRNWFVEREVTYPQREIIAVEIAKKFVDPLLVERGIRSFAATAIDNEQARVALVHLALESEDQATDKGWTKRCFEALTLSALNDTAAESPLTRAEVTERVKMLLPAGHDTQVEEQIAGALNRLTRRRGPVKERDGSYALAFEEQGRLKDKIARFALDEEALKKELGEALQAAVPESKFSDEQRSTIADDLQYGLETLLLRRGEVFARAVTAGEIQQVDAQDVLSIITVAGRSKSAIMPDEAVSAALIEVLEQPSSSLRRHLRRLADAYTMYAFLRQTHDVQRAILSIFHGGELWLDTTVILPLFAETLLDDPQQRHYTTVLRAAVHAGLKLWITEGVLEELERHLNLCQRFAHTPTNRWQSRIPFVYTAYALSGSPRDGFDAWLERFRGADRPIDDIRQYLGEEHAIDLRNLLEQVDGAPLALKAAVQEIWHEVHEQRRGGLDSNFDGIARQGNPDSIARQRLVAHDVENYVGVIQLRGSSADSPLGYQHWFLTLDRTALRMHESLKDRLRMREVPDSPTLSPDFMTQYLRLGPIRTAVERELWTNLPLLTDISRYEYAPKELIERADSLRREIVNLDERITRRRVRDQLGQLKLKLGPEAIASGRGMEERLSTQIADQEHRRGPQ